MLLLTVDGLAPLISYCPADLSAIEKQSVPLDSQGSFEKTCLHPGHSAAVSQLILGAELDLVTLRVQMSDNMVRKLLLRAP
jgi:hypothetical protein